MDTGFSSTTEACTASDFPRARSSIHCGPCTTMKVVHVKRGTPIGHAGEDAIEILLRENHPTFDAHYRPADNSDAAEERAPWAGASEVDAVLLLIDRAYFEQKARLALGNAVPTLPDHYTAADAFMGELGNALLRDFSRGAGPAGAYLESLAGVIAIHFAIHHCRRHPVAPASVGLPRHKLNNVLAFISEHIGGAIPLWKLAETVHLSQYHFARMFKQATGITPHAYVTRQRIEFAKELLRNTHASLVEVAASVGFETQSHFTGVFRKYAGMTPRVFRVNAQLARGTAARPRMRLPVSLDNRTIPTAPRKDTEEALYSAV